MWELNKHTKKCRNGHSGKIVVANNGTYKCDICAKPQPSKKSLNTHVFNEHFDYECVGSYGRGTVEFVGAW